MEFNRGRFRRGARFMPFFLSNNPHLLSLARRLPVNERHPEPPSTSTDRPPEKTKHSQATESYFRRPLT